MAENDHERKSLPWFFWLSRRRPFIKYMVTSATYFSEASLASYRTTGWHSQTYWRIVWREVVPWIVNYAQIACESLHDKSKIITYDRWWSIISLDATPRWRPLYSPGRKVLSKNNRYPGISKKSKTVYTLSWDNFYQRNNLGNVFLWWIFDAYDWASLMSAPIALRLPLLISRQDSHITRARSA